MMNQTQQGVYLKEMARHTRWALDARARMKAAEDGDERHGALHQMLGHAAMISRLLWPPMEKNQLRSGRARKLAAQRGSRLRDQLALGAKNPLASELLRDHMQRFDLSLDHFISVELDRILVTPGQEAELVRWYDEASDTFHLRGIDYSIRELEQALIDLADRIERLLSQQGEPA